ncbi:YbaB/EbfC family nucleoid-associated protein [Actinoalloteichus hymeniacidonis]|uniref:YbaB/EbfC DNA-binding family protein n=1 Tax=Actinoalloteichus hymeniacidonis TaxID=340345 RepID=A0AAC9HRT3_9PSEU|nr:YbaB/EbfC family nucleoid-associated protein [Actinoalloteichus hymeniacidonis]AOS64193.1 hypothetical protein TL08_16965 [Actinoalloteichus hymeniacidonis]MBB5907739.1 DNA-binding protein YbaB [Actinoalloteichus hymeniacidonis]
MTHDRIRALVAEIEAATEAARVRAEERAAATYTEAIGSGLGTLTVNGQGELSTVDLDVRALRYTNETALADAVKTAIQRAERRAREI